MSVTQEVDGAVEYLVTMATHVPDGTPDGAVAEIRAKEAVRSRQLAEEGRLLRLWRPPLQPGEWRTLGLFAASGTDGLQKALASMPLRIWRTDEVTPLGAHPNDPGPIRREAIERANEYLTTFTISIPDGTADPEVKEVEGREAERAHELAELGHLLRLWTLAKGSALGLWRAQDAAELDILLRSLPLLLAGWMTVRTTPLSEHPNDLALTASRR